MSDETKIKGMGAIHHDGGIAFRVWAPNFLHEPQDGYLIGFPAPGTWRLWFNSDWQGYSDAFEGHPGADVAAKPGEYDGKPFHAALSIGPYSVLIFSQ